MNRTVLSNLFRSSIRTGSLYDKNSATTGFWNYARVSLSKFPECRNRALHSPSKPCFVGKNYTFDGIYDPNDASDSQGGARSGGPSLNNMFAPIQGAIYISKDTSTGFRLSDDRFVTGNIFIVNNHAFSWTVSDSIVQKSHINLIPEQLQILDVVTPKPGKT